MKKPQAKTKTQAKTKHIFRNISLIFLALLFCILYFGSATYTRYKMVDQYNEGVRYYNSGDYDSAAKIFKNLQGWGWFIDGPSPEEYYKMSLANLELSDSSIVICPHCGETILIQ